MKRILTFFVIFVLSMSMLAGCGGGSQEAPPAEEKKAEAPAEEKKEEPAEAPPKEEKEEEPASEEANAEELIVTVTNSSGYSFYELYISSTDADDWGEDLLGETVMIDEESMDFALTVYDSDMYDIRIVDEEDDEYLFSAVLFEDGCEIEIAWESGEVGATGSYTDGGTSYTVGTLESSGSSEASGDSSDWIEMRMFNKTDWDFEEIYIFESGAEDYGYNHVANTDFTVGGDVKIGVNLYDYYDVIIIDEEADTWIFEGIELEDGCRIGIYISNGPQLFVTYPGGYTEEYDGAVY